MTKTSKIILAVSIATFAFSFTGFGSHLYYGILRPLGAVAFIVFFIVNMLDKEMANFDEDQSPGETVKKRATNDRAANPSRSSTTLGAAH